MNEKYELGCSARDTDNDFIQALELFLASDSFLGIYAAAELHWHGTYGAMSKKAKETEIKINLDQAAEYFIRAYGFNKELYNISPASPQLSDKPSLLEINSVLNEAKLLKPDALYQLALLYINEDKLIKRHDATNRSISINPTLLDDLISGCLKTAADHYHPHAAYLWAQRHSNKLSPEERLHYTVIAADPETAKKFFSKKLNEQITYRGHEELKTEINCSAATELPIELRAKKSISTNPIQSIFKTSTVYYSGESILPPDHKSYDPSQVHLLSPNSEQDQVPKTREKLREERLKFFGESNATTKTTAAAPAIETDVADDVSNMNLEPALYP